MIRIYETGTVKDEEIFDQTDYDNYNLFIGRHDFSLFYS